MIAEIVQSGNGSFLQNFVRTNVLRFSRTIRRVSAVIGGSIATFFRFPSVNQLHFAFQIGTICMKHYIACPCAIQSMHCCAVFGQKNLFDKRI
jgi:hypothetical protein